MFHRFALLFLLFLPFSLIACSSSNSVAPLDNEPHPQNWIKTHPKDALAVPDFANCIICHGENLQGNDSAVSCYSCHAFNVTPPFIIHPTDWSEPFVDHRSYVLSNGTATCVNCHGADLHGSPAAPSCFSTSVNGLHCHPDGPVPPPHPVDGSYLDRRNHGPDAKADLTVCQFCHGQSGGPGSNPRFNIGIKSVSNTGCEGCHGVNYAHPADWAGPNNTFHYTAGNIHNACVLCHGVALDGNEAVGVSCLNCHDSTTTFTLDCTACHGYPPDGNADVATDMGVNHRNVADVSRHDTCVLCHGMKESNTGGYFAATENYQLFNKITETIGNHWNGLIEMNSGAGYNQFNFGCTAGCHGNNVDHQLSDSGLPVELKDFGFGATVPHPVDITFFNPLLHGPAAKGLTAAFPDGMTDCQSCHATPQYGGVNPRFDIGIVRLGSRGCEDCHNDLTAHPSVGARDKTHWYGPIYTHANVTDYMTMCTPCHGTNLRGPAEGGVGPACTACHTADPVANPEGCISCHNLPPDGLLPAGNTHPNRPGSHNQHTGLISADPAQSCIGCHPVGGTKAHFNGTTDITIASAYDAKTGGPAVHNPDSTCSGVSCHGGQTTPDWLSGTIDVETQCTSCHAYGSSQYNSYISGKHGDHRAEGLSCTECHNPAALAEKHFSNLATPEFEGDPGATISGFSIILYDPATKSCSSTCHIVEVWKR